MNIYNSLVLGGNHYFLRPQPLQNTDKIAGSFSTASISFSFITHQVTVNASTGAVIENYTTAPKTIGKPAFEIAESLVTPLIKLVQNNRPDSFVSENFSKKIFACQLLGCYSTTVAVHSRIFYSCAANNVGVNKMKARSRCFVTCP